MDMVFLVNNHKIFEDIINMKEPLLKKRLKRGKSQYTENHIFFSVYVAIIARCFDICITHNNEYPNLYWQKNFAEICGESWKNAKKFAILGIVILRHPIVSLSDNLKKMLNFQKTLYSIIFNNGCTEDVTYQTMKQLLGRTRHLKNGDKLIQNVCKCLNQSPCNYCSKILPTKLCTACKSVQYCSISCQKKDWKDNHKKECKLLKI